MNPETYEQEIQQSVECLRKGGVILYPTDTIWGLGCDAQNEDAIERLLQIKKRNAEKSLIILVNSTKEILKYIASPPEDLEFIVSQFERPSTIVYPNAINLPSNLMASDGSLGIRLTRDNFCRSLISRLKSPLVSSSANLSGMPAPANYRGITSEILSSVDYVVQYRQEETTEATASDIYTWNTKDGLSKIR